jgi:enoyl-CoA hydratase/carnithine racemase
MSVERSEIDGVLVVTMDDGKANALTTELLLALRAAVEDASHRQLPLVISGRDGCFCGGFDLGVMSGGRREQVADLFLLGSRLYRDVLEAPVPVVASCTGHALAGGALLLLVADYRVGRAGPYRIGLNEVAIGLPLPPVATAVAADRLTPRHLTASTLFAEVVAPDDAMARGFLDEVAADPLAAACAVATRSAELPARAFATTKRRIRRALVAELAALDTG